jgi:hypothetical protein
MDTETEKESRLLGDLACLCKQVNSIQQQKKFFESYMGIVFEHADYFEAELIAAQAHLLALSSERRFPNSHDALSNNEKNSSEALRMQVDSMQKQLTGLHQKNQRLQIALDTITEHADLVEGELLETKALLETKVRERTKEL